MLVKIFCLPCTEYIFIFSSSRLDNQLLRNGLEREYGSPRMSRSCCRAFLILVGRYVCLSFEYIFWKIQLELTVRHLLLFRLMFFDLEGYMLNNLTGSTALTRVNLSQWRPGTGHVNLFLSTKRSKRSSIFLLRSTETAFSIHARVDVFGFLISGATSKRLYRLN